MQQDVRNCRYPGQPDEEITQRVFYKSFVMVLPILLASVLLGLVALGGMSYGAANASIALGERLPTLSGSLVSLLSFVFFVLVSLFTFGALWIWRNNRILVTNEHIVDIDQTTLFNRSVATLNLSRIQDVSADVKGPVQTLLQYGTVVVQTAGQEQNFHFDYMPRPYEAEQYILEIHKQYMATHHEDDGLRGVEEAGSISDTSDNQAVKK